MNTEKMNNLLKENMTEKGFQFWETMFNKIPPVWDRPSSSTGKYHKRSDGSVHTIVEHTYEMLFAAVKIMRLFTDERKSHYKDAILLSIVLHDAFKYGLSPELSKHTSNQHDSIVANVVRDNDTIFSKLLDDEQVSLLQEALRFHAGRWSSEAVNGFSLTNLKPETLFLHFLDMMSTNNLIKI